MSLVFVLVVPVQAGGVTVTFADKAFFGENPLLITDETGYPVFNGTTTSAGVVLPENHSYTIQFNPGGVTDVARSPDYGAKAVVDFIAQNIVGFILLVLILYLIFGRK